MANEDAIKRALSTLLLLELKSPLPENAIAIISEKITNQTYVEVYSNNEIIKSFYLGDYNSNSGNYIMLKNAEKPYIAYIPTFDFDLRENFSSQAKQWMSKVVFHYKKDEIKELQLTNYKYNEQFFLKIENDKFILKKDKNSGIIQNVDIGNVEFYLSHYENIQFLDFFDNYSQSVTDSFLQQTPIFEISIVNSNNQTVNFKAFELINNNQKDNNVFVGIIDEKDLVLAKYYDFDLLMKNYSYFLSN